MKFLQKTEKSFGKKNVKFTQLLLDAKFMTTDKTTILWIL